MTDSIERALGRVEGRLGSFDSKLDSVLVTLAKSQEKSDQNREAQNKRITFIENQNLQTEYHIQAVLERLNKMEPHVEDMKRMRTQGIAVAAILTTLGGIFGTTLYAMKDYIVLYVRKVLGLS